MSDITISTEQFEKLISGYDVIISDKDGNTLTINSPEAVKQREHTERWEKLKKLKNADFSNDTNMPEDIEVEWGTCPVFTSEMISAIRKNREKEQKNKQKNNSILYKDDKK